MSTVSSDDSWYPMHDVCTDAMALGLDEICFTDHVDYGVKIDADEYRVNPEGARVAECRDRLHDLGFTELCTFEKMQPTFWPL